jgi:hypothetical protein
MDRYAPCIPVCMYCDDLIAISHRDRWLREGVTVVGVMCHLLGEDVSPKR